MSNKITKLDTNQKIILISILIITILLSSLLLYIYVISDETGINEEKIIQNTNKQINELNNFSYTKTTVIDDVKEDKIINYIDRKNTRLKSTQNADLQPMQNKTDIIQYENETSAYLYQDNTWYATQSNQKGLNNIMLNPNNFELVNTTEKYYELQLKDNLNITESTEFFQRFNNIDYSDTYITEYSYQITIDKDTYLIKNSTLQYVENDIEYKFTYDFKKHNKTNVHNIENTMNVYTQQNIDAEITTQKRDNFIRIVVESVTEDVENISVYSLQKGESIFEIPESSIELTESKHYSKENDIVHIRIQGGDSLISKEEIEVGRE